MEETFQLGGREFTSVSQALSAAQDDYILAHLRRSGAMEVLSDAELPEEKRAEELLTRIMISGETFQVLAGCLTENGKSWSREQAQRNALVFAALTDMESKQAMRGALIRFVLGFFAFGVKSSPTSQKSSGPTAEVPATASAAPATSEISPPSSEPSPDTIQAASAR